MNVIYAKNYQELSEKAALLIGGQVIRKPDSVLGFATGSTPIGTYQELVRLHRESGLDFSRTVTFNLDEYFDCPISDTNSYHYFMHDHLFNHINIKKESVHLPDGMAKDAQAECERYEKMIAEAGGVDLQLLGIGHNGHIGFNEPDDHFVLNTQHITLTDSTINANSRFYKNREDVPKTALSMGIGTIMKAKQILMVISGTDKKVIAEKALFGPVTPQVPASILQFHQNVTVILAID